MSEMTSAAPAAAKATPQQLLDAAERFAVARTLIIMLWPYLQAAAFRLVPRWTEACPTLAVDGKWRLYMNPLFVLQQTPLKLALLVTCHELKHALYGHSERLGDYRHAAIEINGREHSLANIAFDLAINSSLEDDIKSAQAYRKTRDQGLIDTSQLVLPPEAIYPSQFVDKAGKPFPSGLLAEAYVELLLQNAQQVTRAGGGGKKGSAAGKAGGKEKDGVEPACCAGECGSGGGQAPQPWEDDTPAEGNDPASGVTEGEQDVLRRQVAKAAKEQGSRLPGTVPGYAERWAEVTLKPPAVDWRRELAAAVRSGLNWLRGQHNRSYVRRNRRQVVVPARSGQAVLPGRVKPDPDLVLVLDTSGSMGNEDFVDAFSEMRAVIAVAGGLVPVIPCDTAASEVQWVRRIEEVRMLGGGGTDMGAGIEHAYAVTKARLIICLSDGYTPYRDHPPADGVKVVMCLTQRGGTKPPDWIKSVYTKPER